MTKQIVVQGDAARLPLPDDSVDLVVTSPPYWGQRVYTDAGLPVPGQHGLEGTPGEFIEALVAATREWVRVVKPTGSLWVNLGDKYLRRGLLGLPWRYTLACIDDLGLTLRAEVVWHKPTGMPERCTDRVARTHEHWFHFVSDPDGYYADVDPLREERVWQRSEGYRGHKPRAVAGQRTHGWTTEGHPDGKIPGSVWSVPTEPFKVPDDTGDTLDVHTAAFPTELPRRIITGWSPAGGLVLDPYAGTGTTGHVAVALGRRAVLVDRSNAYTRLAASPTLTERRARKVLTGKPTAPAGTPPTGQDALFEVA